MSYENKILSEPIFKRLNSYLARAQLVPGEMDGTLDTLKSYFSKFIEEDERDIRLKIKFFEQSALELSQRFEPGLSTEQQVNFELWLGQSFEKFGAWDKAIKNFQQALKLLDKEHNPKLKIETLRSLGHIYCNRNLWKNAIDYYQESLELSVSNGIKEGEALALNSIGAVHFERGRFVQARESWEKGLEMAEEIDNQALIAQQSNNLGILYSMQGEWKKALSYYTKSSALFETLRDYRGLAETYHNMGMAYADAKMYSEAGRWYEKSFELARDLGDVRLQALVKLNRIELYTLVNDNYAGIAFCNQALKTFLQLQDRLGEAETYKFMGILYGRIGNYELAESYFDESIHLAKKYKNPLLEAEDYFHFGVMLKEKGERHSARQFWEKALPLFEQVNARGDIDKTKKMLDELENDS